MSVCPIWGTKISREHTVSHGGRLVHSPRTGGRYVISRRAEISLKEYGGGFKARLTSWLVEQRRLGNECPEITPEVIERVKGSSALRVHERADRLLQYIERETPRINATVDFRDYLGMYPNSDMKLELPDLNFMEMLAVSESIDWGEMDYLLDHLQSKKFLERNGVNNREQACRLTPDGYSRLADLEKVNTASSKVFVAMWFDESMEAVWAKGIAPAIEDAGYEPIRIDKKEHLNKIDDEIIAEIRRSRFVVADFTQGGDGARGGVYYEAGFAHGLNIPVIFSCRADVLEDVHFDTRQYNHIVWETPDELRESLQNRIAAVIGDGLHKAGRL